MAARGLPDRFRPPVPRHGLQKGPWKNYGWLRGFIEQEIAHPAFAFVAAFLQDVVLPTLAFFGMLTFVTELGLGLGLLTGTLTRLVASAGFLWQVNIALQAFNVPGEWYWIWPLLTLPQFTFAACGAGRVLGVDALLRRALDRPDGSAWQRLIRLAT
ncbi:MAG: TQO small subunit DoxD [Candidatus Rokuibacteriota bacterium]